MTGFWTIPFDGGLHIFDLQTANSEFISISQLPQGFAERCLQSLKCGANELCVLHFPLGWDARLFEVLNGFIADRFDGGSRVYATHAGDRAKRQIERMIESPDAGQELLRAVAVHSVVPLKPPMSRAADNPPSFNMNLSFGQESKAWRA